MKKPIFRVFISYEIRNKKKVTRKVNTGTLDTFVLTSNIKEIKNDKELIDRICYINKRKPESVDIKINMEKLQTGLMNNIKLCQKSEK